mgnify:FL=1
MLIRNAKESKSNQSNEKLSLKHCQRENESSKWTVKIFKKKLTSATGPSFGQTISETPLFWNSISASLELNLKLFPILWFNFPGMLIYRTTSLLKPQYFCCFKFIENITWLCGDTEFNFESWQYILRVSEANEWEMFSTQEDKIRFSTSGHVIFFLSYKIFRVKLN